MPFQVGDFVRPKISNLPQDSVWHVICSAGALKLEPENDVAKRVERIVFDGFRFSAQYFDKVVRCRGQWVAVSDCPSEHCGVDSGYNSNFRNLAEIQTSDVATAEKNLISASEATAVVEDLLEATRKREAERLAELKAARAAKAKADKEAAAKAKAEEAKRQLAARLHADRCLGEATLELIAEVSRLNNGGSEQVADASIAQHIDQLQPLAKSYGYRIVKPSMLAQVVKL